MKLIVLVLFLMLIFPAYGNEWNVSESFTPGPRAIPTFKLEKKLNNKYSVGGGWINDKTYTSGFNKFKMQKYSAFSRYWMNETFGQGYLYEAIISYTSVKYDATKLVDGEGDKSGIGLTGSAGYHWQWSHFNIGLTGNLSLYSFETVFEETDTTSEVTVVVPDHYTLWLGLNLGWAF